MLLNEKHLFNYIMSAIEETTGLKRELIISKNRQNELCYARQLFCYLAREFSCTFKSIGSYLNRDHTTVLHSVRAMQNYYDSYPVERETIDLIKKALNIHNFKNFEKEIMKIYIAGKVSKESNRKTLLEKFLTAEYVLKHQGYKTIINPLKLYFVDDNKSAEEQWMDAMKVCIPEVISSDAVYMLADWKDSTGAVLEHTIAESLGKKIIYQDFVV